MSCHQVLSFLQGKAPKENHDILTETLGEHTPSYATVKNWVAQFKRGNFSTCVAPRPGRPKTVTTPEIIDQIHVLILEDGRISVKSIAEQLGISREWVVSIIHEDWTSGSSPRSGSRNSRTRNKNVNGASRLNKFWNVFGAIQMLSCRNWWPWKKPVYVTMTRRHSNNEWSGGIAAPPSPQIFLVQKSSENFSPRFFLIQGGILLIDYLPKGQTLNAECYSSLLVQLKDIFKEGHERGLVRARQCPRLTGHFQPRR